MPSQTLGDPVGILVKTSLVDFPGRVAATVFLKGCQLRCPYCYNRPLVEEDALKEEANAVTLEDIFLHLEKRKNVLTGLAVSGGEPLLNKNLVPLIKKAKSLGLKVKLDTNGLLPNKLEELCADSQTCPDYIAMDIKTSPEKYALLQNGNTSKAENFKNLLLQSIEVLKKFPPNKREWRTVLVPPLVQKEEIKIMASMLPKDAQWYFAQFQNRLCLNESYNSIPPYTDSQMQELLLEAKAIIPGSQLR